MNTFNESKKSKSNSKQISQQMWKLRKRVSDESSWIPENMPADRADTL